MGQDHAVRHEKVDQCRTGKPGRRIEETDQELDEIKIATDRLYEAVEKGLASSYEILSLNVNRP